MPDDKETQRPNRRKVRQGVVVSNKPDKTVVVKVSERAPHARYRKIVQRTRKFHAHDESNTCGEGDLVRIEETRPLSKFKHWRVVEIVERAR